ncbi:hypothetical protein RJ640_017375, partial [Escallonia rubra]
MAEPRRLRGHKATATCCIASVDSPGLVATSGEDGCVCWFDVRCKDVLFVMKVGNEDIIYVSSGNEVKGFDVHLGLVSKASSCKYIGLALIIHVLSTAIMKATSWKPLESYNYNKEEINQIVCNSKSAFVAAADDGGDVKIIDIRQKCLYKTLRAGHKMYSFFLGDNGKVALFAVITGGLDSKLVMWDFSKGRPCKILDFGIPGAETRDNAGQCFNPAFIHAIAVPEVDMWEKLGRICVVARGDGGVDVIDIESELASTGSKSSLITRRGSQSRSKGSVPSPDTEAQEENLRKKLHLDYSFGGHTTAVSCVAFSKFGEKGKYIISGGNDKTVKAWDWSRYFDDGQTSSKSDLLHLNINLSRKVNWLCTTPTDSENLVVCDTSKVVK